jgi:hypothetical protein
MWFLRKLFLRGVKRDERKETVLDVQRRLDDEPERNEVQPVVVDTPKTDPPSGLVQRPVEESRRNLKPYAFDNVLPAEFVAKVVQISNVIGIDPNHLLACIAFETGERFKSNTVNRISGATGLIQFMPITAKNLGTTCDELERMTEIQQLDYVLKYFFPYRNRLKTLSDVYMAILWPAAIGKPENFVLFTRNDSRRALAYKQNAGLDLDKDGYVTKAEATAKVVAKLEKGMKHHAQQ